METKPAALTILFFAAATAVYDALLNPYLPAVIPSHWNINGQVDGYSPKIVLYLSLSPLLPLLLLYVIPSMPSRLLERQSLRATNYMLVAIAAFLFYAGIVTLQLVLHPGLPEGKFVLTGVLLLLMLLGNVLGKTRRNPWSGIRLPWTLASDSNWIATHRMAGRLWVGMSLAGIALLWLGLPMTLLLPAVLLPLVVIPILYSYLLFRRTQENGEGPA